MPELSCIDRTLRDEDIFSDDGVRDGGLVGTDDKETCCLEQAVSAEPFEPDPSRQADAEVAEAEAMVEEMAALGVAGDRDAAWDQAERKEIDATRNACIQSLSAALQTSLSSECTVGEAGSMTYGLDSKAAWGAQQKAETTNTASATVRIDMNGKASAYVGDDGAPVQCTEFITCHESLICGAVASVCGATVFVSESPVLVGAQLQLEDPEHGTFAIGTEQYARGLQEEARPPVAAADSASCIAVVSETAAATGDAPEPTVVNVYASGPDADATMEGPLPDRCSAAVRPDVPGDGLVLPPSSAASAPVTSGRALGVDGKPMQSLEEWLQRYVGDRVATDGDLSRQQGVVADAARAGQQGDDDPPPDSMEEADGRAQCGPGRIHLPVAGPALADAQGARVAAPQGQQADGQRAAIRQSEAR